MDSLIQDLKIGLRSLVQAPLRTTVTILTLALGIGTVTALFSVVDGVLLRPLPYRDPGELVTLWRTNGAQGGELENEAPGNFLDWREHQQVFAGLASAEPFGFDLMIGEESERLPAWRVSADFFAVLGTPALVGRTPSGDEEGFGASPVVVLDHSLWREGFGGEPKIVGSQLTLSGEPYTVVGVMPPEFDFPGARSLWVTHAFEARDRAVRNRTNLTVVARLLPGVSMERAQEEMTALAANLGRNYPETNRGVGVAVVPLTEQVLGGVRPALWVLFAAGCLLLTIAGVNVASLLLGRGLERRRELSSRAALGATPRRLARMLATEHFLLVLLGGSTGLVVAGLTLRFLRGMAAAGLPRIEQVAIDFRALAFALALTLLTALLFGLAPALRVRRLDLQADLNEEGRGVSAGGSSQRLRRLLVAAQVAITMVLLVSAGLLGRSLVRLLAVDLGFDPKGVLGLEVHVWDRFKSPTSRAAFFEQAMERLAAVPGIEAAGATSALPQLPSRSDRDASFNIVGRPALTPEQQPTAYLTAVTVGTFETLRTPVIRGRTFTRFDRADSPPVAVVSETLARRYWPGETALGQKIEVRSFGQVITREIVGVVADLRHSGLASLPRAEIFLPHPQYPYGSMALVARTAGSAAELLPAARRAVRELAPGLTFAVSVQMEQLVADSLADRRLSLALIAAFALLAYALAAVGVFGLIALAIGQRQHEFGLRLALGAQRRDILGLLLREGLGPVLAGAGLGTLGALLAGRLLDRLLYGVPGTDPATYVVMLLLLVAMVLAASWWPMSRALRGDTVGLLRIQN